MASSEQVEKLFVLGKFENNGEDKSEISDNQSVCRSDLGDQLGGKFGECEAAINDTPGIGVESWV